jgi:hypothetical protein
MSIDWQIGGCYADMRGGGQANSVMITSSLLPRAKLPRQPSIDQQVPVGL